MLIEEPTLYGLDTDRPNGRVREVSDMEGTTGVELVRCTDRRALGERAAADIAAALRSLLAGRDGFVRVVFASAPSQRETLAALAAAPGIDWSRVVAFHMDEYIGLPEGAPQRFGRWLRTHFVDHVPIGEFDPIDPGDDPETEAARYAARLAAAPIDIVCLGIGVNGHIAFNDPPVADFDDPLAVKPVALDAACRRQQVDEGCFASLAEVPASALTLTVPRLLDAGRLFCMAPGAAKREAVTAALHGPLSTRCPASALRTHPRCTLYVDADSGPLTGPLTGPPA